ncbi:delta-type opioid receptor-like [Clupea harengus]|uniref:Delta-type opioid receptor-like n=1 Tax=Clupea harengus TaxID=7950 RepID=A0A6P8F8U9_CLUHA|nr:delta-type opioid receptor-like [Clupea harengus]
MLLCRPHYHSCRSNYQSKHQIAKKQRSAMREGGAINGSGVWNASATPDRLAWDIQQLLVPTLDALIMLTGTIGHSLVIFVLAGRRKRTAGPPHGTDTLLLALSASDLLLLTCLPFHTAAIALGTWPFGDFLCKAVSFLGVACSGASVFTLSALAVSRYLAVVHPTWAFGRWRTGRWLNAVVALLWVPACALAAPQFAFRAVGTSVGPLHCFAFLSDLSQRVYGTALFLMGFALPLAVIVLMYAKIYCFLRHTRRQGRAPQLERYQSQVTKTCALLVLVFTLCWLPSYVLMLMLVGDRLGTGSLHYRSFAICARLLASSSTVVNPALYVFMSHKFRQELIGLSRHRCRDCKACWDYCPGLGRDKVQPFNPVELETPPPQG